MNSEDLALLLGLVGGGFGGYYGGKRREERERENKKQDVLDAADLQRQLLEQQMAFEREMEEKAKAEAEEYDKGGFDLIPDLFDAINPFQRFEYGTPVNPDSNTYFPLPGNPFNDPRQTDTFPYGLDINPFFNEGGRVGYAEGTLEQGVQAEPGLLESIFGEKITDTIQRGYLDFVGGGKDSISMSEWDNLYNQLIQSGESHEEALKTLGERPTLIGKADGGRVGLAEGSDERGVFGRAVDVGTDYITRLRRGVLSPEEYEEMPGLLNYINPFDLLGTMNEAIGLERVLSGVDQQADQKVLDIFGTPNPNYDPSVVGTGDILDPLLMDFFGLPQDQRLLGDD